MTQHTSPERWDNTTPRRAGSVDSTRTLVSRPAAPESVRPHYLVVTALLIAVVAAMWSRESLAITHSPITTPPSALAVTQDQPSTVDEPSTVETDVTGVYRVIATTTTTIPEPADPVLIADPRLGDMRVDDGADVLPLSYTPPPAETTLLDVAYGPAEAQLLDLFLPENTDAPVLIFLHAGGWVAGDRKAVPDMVLHFVERGYAVASVEYHLAPDFTFPQPVHDVKMAIRWLKAYGTQEGTIDGNRMVLSGASAGGHLAAFVGATAGDYEPPDLAPELAAYDSTVAGIASFVGPTDLAELYAWPHPWAAGLTGAFLGCDPCEAPQLTEAGILDHLDHTIPPAYWAYGNTDPLIDLETQAIAIAEAWAWFAGANSSWLDIVEGHGHNLDESLVNLRVFEEFVDYAVGLS